MAEENPAADGLNRQENNHHYERVNVKIVTAMVAACMGILLLSSCGSPALPDQKPAPTTPVPPLQSETTWADEMNIAPNPEWNDAARRAALDVAEAALRAYTNTTLPQPTWFAELAQHLTNNAREAYKTVPTERIPATAVTGDGKIIENSSGYLAIAEYPTNAGPYLVMVQRKDGATPWLVERITPAKDEP